MKSFFIFAVLLSFLILPSPPLHATDSYLPHAFSGELAPPQNKRSMFKLTIDGEKHRIKLPELDQLPSYEAILPMRLWKNEDGAYQGFLIDDLLISKGILEYKKLRFLAIDGYVVELSKTEISAKQGFIATRYKGKEISIPQKGPSRLLLMAQIHPSTPVNTITSSWIWNIREIIVLKPNE